MARSPRPARWGWVYDPAEAFRRSGKPVPLNTQQEVERCAQELIASTLKPRYIEPPPKKAELNYLVDISCKWRGPFFYFCSKYCSPGPRALSPLFDSKFARLQYAGDQRFNLAYFRHTGQWWEVMQFLTLDEGLAEIEAGRLFTP